MELLAANVYLFGLSGWIGGLITLVVFAIVALLVIFVLQKILGAFGVQIPPNIWMLIQLLIVLIAIGLALRIFGVA